MKNTISNKQQFKKIKTAYQSKRNSNGTSLIYKEITSQMENLFNRNNHNNNHNYTGNNTIITNNNSSNNSTIIRNDKNKYDKNQRNQKKGIIQQKYSLHNIKKKSSAVNFPFQTQNQPQLKENFMLTFNHSHNQNNGNNNSHHNINNNQYPTNYKIQNPSTIVKQIQLQKKMFKYQYIIGKGGFGKVWRVQHIKNRNQYALKQMLKSLVMTKKSVQSVMNQRMLLTDLSSPFIVNMHYAFQDRDTLYLVLDLMEGGDLRYHIGNKNFTQIQAKFFIACIILGLQYLHNNKIIHRDIKPENLVLDSRGYVRITDLGIARILKSNNSTDTSGTPGYMSPQVICRQNHGFVSDFFALGVIAYELMTGKRPYQGRSRAQIRDQMLAKQVQIKASDIPDDWSYQAADFINKLIQRKPDNRLGSGGVNQLKSHPWVKDLNWKKLLSKEIQSPFIPLMKKSNFDQDDQITIEDQQQAELIQKNSLLLRKSQFQQLFKNYYFDGRKQRQRQKQSNNNMIKSTKNNFFNQNQVFDQNETKQKKDTIINSKQTKQKISLKRPETSVTNSRQHVKYKNSLQTVDSISRQNKRRQSKPGIHLIQSHNPGTNHIPYTQQKKFFKDFRF